MAYYTAKIEVDGSDTIYDNYEEYNNYPNGISGVETMYYQRFITFTSDGAGFWWTSDNALGDWYSSGP
jgi:hypothetical protein